MYINNDLINKDFLEKIKVIRREKDEQEYTLTIDDYNHVNGLIRIQNILLEALNKLSRVYNKVKMKRFSINLNILIEFYEEEWCENKRNLLLLIYSKIFY